MRTNQVLSVSLDGSARVEPVILALPTAQGPTTNHHGAGLARCGEYLYVSTSDGDSLRGRVTVGSQRAAERARAQLPNSGFGQIMRWRFEGIDLVPDGVFGAEYPSFAMGLRNPFGIGCDPETGYALVADNGEGGHDQVRLAEPGSNHGWPTTFERYEVVAPWFDTRAS
ncbi:MAG TPA: PQQ-dependent sugar dehydrogenase, partial [Tepidiformaceae bacterium]|nr:PQQ-dependent sugar dehydrogenase [Tepidiformaceae bacterium]